MVVEKGPSIDREVGAVINLHYSPAMINLTLCCKLIFLCLRSLLAIVPVFQSPFIHGPTSMLPPPPQPHPPLSRPHNSWPGRNEFVKLRRSVTKCLNRLCYSRQNGQYIIRNSISHDHSLQLRPRSSVIHGSSSPLHPHPQHQPPPIPDRQVFLD